MMVFDSILSVASSQSRLIACIRGPDPGVLWPVCARLTPCIERHPAALILDLAGSERLLLGHEDAWDGEQVDAIKVIAQWSRIAERLHHLLASPDATVLWVGVAQSRTVAWLAAQAAGGAWRAVTPQETAPFLRMLPVQSLLTLPELAQIPGAACAASALGQGGIRTMGQLARLSPLALQRRFGALGLALARLAAGHDLTPLRAPLPSEHLGARLCLDPPQALERLAGALDPLAAFLAQRLQQRHLEASDVLLVMRTVDGPPWRTARRLGHATANRGALLDHARRLLEQLGAEHAITSVEGQVFVSAIHLRVGSLCPARARQRAFWPPSPRHQQAMHQLTQRLVGRPERTPLWHALLTAPHAVLPEERYVLQAVRQTRLAS